MRLALLLRELEQVERAFDVDVMRRNRRELGARGEERGEVEHAVDLELGEDPLEQAGVGDRAGELAPGQRGEAPLERVHVQRDDGRFGRGQPRHERVPDFTARPRDQDNRLPHVPKLYNDAEDWPAGHAKANLKPEI